LVQRDKAERARSPQLEPELLQAALDVLSSMTTILDESGTIDRVNESWRRFALVQGIGGSDGGLGQSYISVMEALPGFNDQELQDLRASIRRVNEGQGDGIDIELAGFGHQRKGRLLIRGTPVVAKGRSLLVISHEQADGSATAGKPGPDYRTIADMTYDWEYWQDPDGSLRYVSPSCERITGYPPERFVTDPDLLGNLVVAQDKLIWNRHHHDRKRACSETIQFRIRCKNGELRWIEHACRSVLDESGGFLGYRVSNRDITQRMEATEELREHGKRLEELVAERADELEHANAALREEIADRKQAEEALKRSQERYALAQRAASVGSWDWNLETGHVHWTEQIEPMFGFGPGGFGGTYEAFLQCVHSDDRQRVTDAVDACVREGDSYAIEHRIVWPDGTVRWVAETGNVYRDAAGSACRMLGVVQDVTIRKRVETELRKAKEAAEKARREEEERRQEADLRRQIAESLGDILTVLNSNRPLDQVLDYIAVKAGELLGTRAAGIYRLEGESGTLSVQALRGLLVTYVAGADIRIGQGALKAAVASHRPVAVPDLCAALENGGSLALDADQMAAAGAWARVYRALLAVPIIIQNEAYGGLLLYYGETRSFSDEEIGLAAAFGEQIALAIGNARLRDQIEAAAATAERERLARELHDAVTQTLFSATLIAEAMPRVWDVDQAQGRRGLEELRALTRGAAAEMRTLLVELRPTALTEKPLGELLRHLTDAMTSRARVPIDLKVQGKCVLSPDVQIALYRIAQEGLNNTAKHAAASQISVALECSRGRALLSVRDDGCGFDTTDILPDRFGVAIMGERAEGIGATLEIGSKPGQGTQIIVRWQAPGEMTSE